MAGRIRRLAIFTTLSGILLLAIVLLAVAYADVGITDDFWAAGFDLATQDFSEVPQSVMDDAAVLATELFGDSLDRYQAFVDQLLASYAQSTDKDFLVVFNSGGWGWNLPQKSPGWSSILSGVQSELDDLGYTSLVLNYRRTDESTWGCVKEFIEVLSNYPSKAMDLTQRVEFLTSHNPDLKIIVAGESNGTVIVDNVMDALQDNQQVYSIQTGSPFWHSPVENERKLVLNDNGTGPDAFNAGDIPAMVWFSLKASLGITHPDDRPGTIFLYLKAPGHDYSWQYPQVCSQIKEFLTVNFETK